MSEEKKYVAELGGKKTELSENGEMAFLQVGDIIIRDSSIIVNRAWCGIKARVVGFTHNPDRLWAVITGDSGYYAVTDSKNKGGLPKAMWTSDWKGLVLLARPNYKFKVGSRVKAQGRMMKGKEGKVIVINPNSSVVLCYLVAFDKWEQSVASDKNLFNCVSWMPAKYCASQKNCCWCSENELTRI